MRARLGKKVVEGIVPMAHDVIAWDVAVAGFAVRVTPSGRRTYFMKYRTKSGRQRKPNVGVHGAITCEQARAIAQSWAAAVAAGNDPMDQRDAQRASPTITDLCQRALDEDARPRLKRRSVEEFERLIGNVIVPKIGSLKVTSVTRAQVARLHHELRNTKPQANRVLAALSKMFNLAERWGLRVDGTNPCRHVPRYAEKARDRFLSREEIERLLAALDLPQFAVSPFATFVRLALTTGRRKSEILNVMWEDVDFEARTLRLKDTKTGPQTVVLNDAAIDILLAARRAGQVYVIAGRNADAPAVGVQKWWVRLCAAAGLQGATIHTIRHSFASVGAAQGLSLHQIGALLGHKNTNTTMRYAHHYDDALRATSNMIGNKLAPKPGPKGTRTDQLTTGAVVAEEKLAATGEVNGRDGG